MLVSMGFDVTILLITQQQAFEWVGLAVNGKNNALDEEAMEYFQIRLK